MSWRICVVTARHYAEISLRHDTIDNHVFHPSSIWRSLHIQDWEPVTITLQALHSGKRWSRSKVRFKLCQQSMWMQDGRKVCMDSYMASNGTCFIGHLDYFQKPPYEGRLNTRTGDHGTPNTHHCWIILIDRVWGSTWIEVHWNQIWLRAWSHMTSYYTRGSVTTWYDFGGVLGWPLNTFLWTLTISWSRLLARVWSESSDPTQKKFNPLL